jgi:hypothetical protein
VIDCAQCSITGNDSTYLLYTVVWIHFGNCWTHPASSPIRDESRGCWAGELRAVGSLRRPLLLSGRAVPSQHASQHLLPVWPAQWKGVTRKTVAHHLLLHLLLPFLSIVSSMKGTRLPRQESKWMAAGGLESIVRIKPGRGLAAPRSRSPPRLRSLHGCRQGEDPSGRRSDGC